MKLALGQERIESCRIKRGIHLGIIIANNGYEFDSSERILTILRDNFKFDASEVHNAITIDIRNGVKIIPNRAFENFRNLCTINIPSSVLSIGADVFFNCTCLKDIHVDEANPYYASENGILFNKNKTTLLKYPIGKSNLTYTVPDSVIEIGSFSFMKSKTLTTVSIPGSVVIVGDYAFAYSVSLKSLALPHSVKYIGTGIFAGCTTLESVQLSNSIFTLHAFTFLECKSLKTIILPKSLRFIEIAAFDGCLSLESVFAPPNSSKSFLDELGQRVPKSVIEIKPFQQSTTLEKGKKPVPSDQTNEHSICIPSFVKTILKNLNLDLYYQRYLFLLNHSPGFIDDVLRTSYKNYKSEFDAACETLGGKINVAFIGRPGIGKTTMICSWLRLFGDEEYYTSPNDAVLLPTASGRTTAAEVHILQSSIDTYIEVIPYPKHKIEQLVRSLCEELYSKYHGTKKGSSVKSDDFHIEYRRALLNMAKLSERENPPKDYESVKSLVNKTNSVNELTYEFLSRVDLLQRTVTKYQFSTRIDTKKLLKQFISEINNGLRKDCSLPKKILIYLSEIEYGKILPKNVKEIIDTVGLDSENPDESLMKVITDPNTIVFFIDEVTSAPSTGIKNLIIKAVNQVRDENIVKKIGLVVRASKEELENVNESEGDSDKGLKLKLGEIITRFDHDKIPYRSENILFVDPLEIFTKTKTKVNKRDAAGKIIIHPATGKPQTTTEDRLTVNTENIEIFSELDKVIEIGKEYLSERLHPKIEKLSTDLEIVLEREFEKEEERLQKLYMHDPNRQFLIKLHSQNYEIVRKTYKYSDNWKEEIYPLTNQKFTVLTQISATDGTVSNSMEKKTTSFHGKGVIKWLDGSRYYGMITNGIRDGAGATIYANGDYHEGSYVLGNPEGEGVYYEASGRIYEGQFHNGKFHGSG